jgi:hypothetical protein
MLNKKEVIKIFFMMVAMSSIIYFWLIVSNLVSTSVAESWLKPIIFFGVAFIFWSLAIFLEAKKSKLFLFSLVLIFSGIIFEQNIFFILSAFFAVAILYLGSIWVQESMASRIKLNIWMSLRLGRRLFVMAIAIVAIGGFLMPTLLSGRERTLPLIKITNQQSKLVGRAMSIFDPTVNQNNITEITVDEYILKQQGRVKNNRSLVENNSSSGFMMAERRAILIAGRESISRLVERDVLGGEKIIGIFAEVINNKINDYFNTGVSQASGLAPLLFALLSFLTIFSVGSFLTSFLTFVIIAIFKLLLLTKLVKIGTKEVEVEVIE